MTSQMLSSREWSDLDGDHVEVVQENGVVVTQTLDPDAILADRAADGEAQRLAILPSQADINAAMATALEAGDMKRAAAFLRCKTQGDFEAMMAITQ